MAIVSLLIAACQAGEEQASEANSESETVELIKSVVASCSPTGFMVDRCWPDGALLSVGAPVQHQSDVTSAVQQWNALLEPAAFLGAPRFASSVGATGDVVIEVFGTAPYCDRVDLSTQPATIRLYNQNDPQCAASNVGDFISVLKHGLGHVLGWTNNVHTRGVAGISDNCIMYLGAQSRPVGGDVCLHDVEAVFRAYQGSTIPNEYFEWRVAQKTDLRTQPLTLPRGAQFVLTLTEAASTAPPAAASFSLPRTPSEMTWNSSLTTVATVGTDGVVTAVGNGTARIRATLPTSRLPLTGYVAWSPLAVRGDGFDVTVVDPPLRVIDITTPEGPPLTRDGYHTFTAVWTGGPGGTPDSVRWQIDDSRTGPGIDVTIMRRGSMELTRLIQAGSYSLQFTALPYKSGQAGSAYAEDYPVCTDNGGLAGTDADEGCGGGGGIE
jgi:hypothetical protein